jgi:Mrp family chromosome partitioning ATPase
MAVTDAAILASQVDGVILVVESGSTHQSSIKETTKRLEQVGGKILGGVLNQIPARNAPYFHYPHYAYGRGEAVGQVEQKQAKQRRWWQRLPVSK